MYVFRCSANVGRIVNRRGGHCAIEWKGEPLSPRTFFGGLTQHTSRQVQIYEKHCFKIDFFIKHVFLEMRILIFNDNAKVKYEPVTNILNLLTGRSIIKILVVEKNNFNTTTL